MRVRNRFDAETMSTGRTTVKITASMGIASTEICGYALDVLMNEADIAVYAAKRDGRNKVVVATALNVVESGARPAAG